MSKAKGKKANSKAQAGADDDDWEAILAEEAKANGSAQLKEEVKAPEIAVPTVSQPEEDNESDDDEEGDGDVGAGAKKVCMPRPFRQHRSNFFADCDNPSFN
jgi:hypothetical protein